MSAEETTEFSRRYGPWAVVVGASEGVGAAGAEELAARGLDLLLLARNGALLDEVADGVRARHGVEVRTMVVDLLDVDASERIVAAADGLEVGLLFYTAGAAGAVGRFIDLPLDHARKMLRLNCSAPTELAHAFAPAMVERGAGAVVLVGSTGCFAGQPYVSSYSASKAFQVNLAEGLWSEMKDDGVDVLCAPIGSTTTPARTRRLGVGVDEDLDMSSEAVALEIIDHMGDGPTRVVSKLNSGIGPLAAPWAEFRALAVPTMAASMSGFTARARTPEGDQPI
jgi:short-subunit dehydrogenase